MVCRAIHVTTHYLRLDPYGFPIVARVDRFWKFALVAKLALCSASSFTMFIATLFKRVNGARLALVFGGGYLLLGIFDLEVYRYLRQHINLAYIRTYLRPSVLVDETFLLVLKTDGWEMLFVIFALSTIGRVQLFIDESPAVGFAQAGCKPCCLGFWELGSCRLLIGIVPLIVVGIGFHRLFRS